MQTIKIARGEGKYKVSLHMTQTDDGWFGGLTGGERSHVGGVVLALPRPSLRSAGTSCDVCIIPAPGHKDTDIAAPLAKKLCSALAVPVSLSAGLHIDDATPADIKALLDNCWAAGAAFLEQAQQN